MTATEIIKDFGAVVIAAIALIVSLLGYRIARRTELRLVKSATPLITAKLFPIKGQPCWFHVYWSVENRADHQYKCNFIEFSRPWFSRGMTRKQAYTDEDKSDPFKHVPVKLREPIPIDVATKKVPMTFTLAKGGVPQHGPFPGCTHWESTYVCVSSWAWPRWLSMRISLSSIDIEEREIVFTVRRKIPADAKTNTDSTK